MARFLEGQPEVPMASRVSVEENKLYLEFPAFFRRGLRPQDVVSAVFGLENASSRLTRELIVFRRHDDRPTGLSRD
jgi:hypothetical protein